MGFLNEPEQGIELASQGFGQDAGDTEKKPYSISLREGYRPEVRDVSKKRPEPLLKIILYFPAGVGLLNPSRMFPLWHLQYFASD